MIKSLPSTKQQALTFGKAFNAGEETFMFRDEYTEVRKGRAEGVRWKVWKLLVHASCYEKDERERRERMIKAEAKRLGISEERLKEIMLEREQLKWIVDARAAERQSATPLLVGGQTG